MKKTKSPKIYYYDVKDGVDLTSCLQGFLYNSTSEEMSIGRSPIKQLRGVQEQNGVILARICKIVVEGKPLGCDPYNPSEKELEDSFVFSSHMLYDKSKKRVLIEHNGDNSGVPNTVLTRLIKQQCADINVAIGLIMRKDAVKEILEKKGLLETITMPIDKETAQYLALASGDSADMSDNQLESGEYIKEVTIKAKINRGSLSESFIKNIVNRFKKGEIKNAKFGVGTTNLVELRHFSKFEKIEVELTDKKHFDTDDFYQQLVQLNNET